MHRPSDPQLPPVRVLERADTPGLGFRQDFHPDGSMLFSGNMMKVEFLPPEKARRRKTPKFISEIAVTPPYPALGIISHWLEKAGQVIAEARVRYRPLGLKPDRDSHQKLGLIFIIPPPRAVSP
jgi:hypothetical protein